jgi:hypothetical protein
MGPIAIGLITAGALKAGAGIAQGVGQARAGKKMMLTEAEQKELEELEKRKRRGELGLTERELGTIEQRFLAEQAGAQRELEAAALQQAAARGLGGAVSGRDIFLQEQAQAGAERQMRQQQNVMVQEADKAEADAEAARIDAMNAQQKAAEAQRAQGIAQAVSLGLAGAGDAVSQATGMMQEANIAQIQAQAQAGATRDLLREYDASGFGSFGQTPGQATQQRNVFGTPYTIDPTTGRRIYGV